jgi:D-allulose-6-phosphate 3-epimerase
MNSKGMRFSPSLMCMNLLKVEEQIHAMNGLADFYHVDIMDGNYVKNFSLSPMFIKQIRPLTSVGIDAHMMVRHPCDFLEELAAAGADYISPQADTITKEAFRVMHRIKELGCKAGVVLNPADSIECIHYYLPLVDKVTVMTVDPGFAGQNFIPQMAEKIEQLKKIRGEKNYSFLIEIDGACNVNTYKILTQAGADVLILGSSGLFNLDGDIKTAFGKMTASYDKAMGE